MSNKYEDLTKSIADEILAPEEYERDADGDGISDYQEDLDGNGRPDQYGDTTYDGKEDNGIGKNGEEAQEPILPDRDGDGIPDLFDPDPDR